jgi:hypothetical protein
VLNQIGDRMLEDIVNLRDGAHAKVLLSSPPGQARPAAHENVCYSGACVVGTEVHGFLHRADRGMSAMRHRIMSSMAGDAPYQFTWERRV